MHFTGITESLSEYLRSLIIDQKLKPGQKLNEIELSSKLGISRSPLREAFRVLSGEQLVEIVPRKGSYVTRISMEDCIEIFEAREMLEVFAVGLLERKKMRKIPGVEKAMDASSGIIFPVDAEPEEKFRYLKAIANFHINLVGATGNSKLTYYYDCLFPNLARYQAMYVFIEGLMENSQKEHREIYSMIQAGKYKDARQCIQKHIKSWPPILEEQLSQLNT